MKSDGSEDVNKCELVRRSCLAHQKLTFRLSAVDQKCSPPPGRPSRQEQDPVLGSGYISLDEVHCIDFRTFCEHRHLRHPSPSSHYVPTNDSSVGAQKHGRLERVSRRNNQNNSQEMRVRPDGDALKLRTRYPFVSPAGVDRIGSPSPRDCRHCVRALETEEVRARRAERNKKKELRVAC
jgi:hypothetical protein